MVYGSEWTYVDWRTAVAGSAVPSLRQSPSRIKKHPTSMQLHGEIDRRDGRVRAKSSSTWLHVIHTTPLPWVSEIRVMASTRGRAHLPGLTLPCPTVLVV